MNTRFLRQAAIASLLASAMALPALGTANAATCIEQVHQLAERYNITSKPPKANLDTGGVTTKELSKSGGVVKPPPVADQSVITPAHPSADHMRTLPDVTASTLETPRAEAVERASLQSLLMAARSDAEHGREAQCLARVQEAHELLARR